MVMPDADLVPVDHHVTVEDEAAAIA